MVQFGNLPLFLSSDENFASALSPKQVVAIGRWLQLELAPTVDAGRPFVKATYHLERDGPLAFERYESIATVEASMHQMVQYALSCIQPGLQHFTNQLGFSLREIESLSI